MVTTERGFFSPRQIKNTINTGSPAKVLTCDNSEDMNLQASSLMQDTFISSDKNCYQLDNILDSRKLKSFKRQFVHQKYADKTKAIRNNIFISLQNRSAFPDKIPESANDDKVTVGASNQHLDTLGVSQPNSVIRTDRFYDQSAL